ncbi:Cilia- and flagella-associated protein 58 [Blattella germanica]|nr:Cilia- and flagella-associated protein 58 [Blattella germanica]
MSEEQSETVPDTAPEPEEETEKHVEGEDKQDEEKEKPEKDTEEEEEEETEKEDKKDEELQEGEVGEEPIAQELNEYQQLELAYKEVHGELENMEGMEKFGGEYTRLFEAYYHTYDQVEDLAVMTNTLQEYIDSYKAQLEEASENIAAEQTTVAKLNEEIKMHWKTIDAAHARELMLQQVIEDQNNQISKLTAEIELKNRMAFDPEEPDSSKKEREKLIKDKERLEREINMMRGRVENAAHIQETLERRNFDLEKKVEEVKQVMGTQDGEITNQLKTIQRLEYESKQLNEEMETKRKEYNKMTEDLQTAQSNISDLEEHNHLLMDANERHRKELLSANVRLNTLNSKVETQKETIKKLTTKNYTLIQEMKTQNEEIASCHIDITRLEKQGAKCKKEITQMQAQKDALQQNKEQLKSIISDLEKELETGKREAEESKSTIKELQKEKEILSKNVLKAAAASYEQQRIIKHYEQVKKNLQVDLDNYILDSRKKKKIISDLEKEKDRFIYEAQELNLKMQDTLDEMKVKQIHIFDLKKKLAESDTKFRMLQNQLDAVSGERNSLNKLLLEAEDQITEKKHHLKVLNHHIEELKEDIATKERRLRKVEAELEKSEKEKENIRVELKKVRKELEHAKEYINELLLEEVNLLRIIQAAEYEINKQKKKMVQLVNERDIAGTQIVRRNDKLTIMIEKTKLMQHTLDRGEAQYNQRLEDIRLLKMEIKRLRQEKNLLCKSVNSAVDMRQEMLHLNRDLTRAQQKCKALEDEIVSPVNIHRWRKLEGSDPDTFELIKKIQLLERRLLIKDKEAQKQEAKLHETDRLYQNLRDLLSRQPGQEVSIRLQKTQMALQSRGRKMKCLISERNMFEAEVTEYKFDLERTTEELKEVKKKYLVQKRREEQLKRERELAAKNKLPPIMINSNAPRFLGGGFNLTVTSKC